MRACLYHIRMRQFVAQGLFAWVGRDPKYVEDDVDGAEHREQETKAQRPPAWRLAVGIDDSNTPQSIADGVEARVLHDDEVPVDCPRPAKQQTARRKHCE